MVRLCDVGLADHSEGKQAVSILVGPNGSGKSSVLLEIAKRYKSHRNVTIICNTPHDRFVGLRGVKRISAGRSDQRPKEIVKKAVAESLSGFDSSFFKISSILEHCGYKPKFGFEILESKYYGYSVSELREELNSAYNPDSRSIRNSAPVNDQTLEMALSFLQRRVPRERLWVDARDSSFEFSQSSELAAVLELETKLRRWQVIRGVRVLLEREHAGEVIELQNASSGQLALISTLLYLVTNVGNDPIVIIDEPENSLHPRWQSSYVENVFSALRYIQVSLIIATHAPLVVTGALADSSDQISVFSVSERIPVQLPIKVNEGASSGIEAILWDAFEVVTPANHFVSNRIVDEISRFEKGEVGKNEVLTLIERMEVESFDSRQRDFFDAVKQLLSAAENTSENGSR